MADKPDIKEEKDVIPGVKKADEEKAEVAKSDEVVSEEDLLKAIETLEEFSKAAKAEEEEEEDEDDEDEEEKKSIEESDDDNETLEKAIEVSPFLEALVNETSLALEAVGKDVNGLRKSVSDFDGKYIEILKALNESIKGLSSKIEAFEKSTSDRLAVIETQPAGARKSIMKAVEIKKAFVGGEGGGDPDFNSLSKRQVADALTKAWQDGKIKDTTVMAFEGEHNYQLRQDEQEIVKSYIK